MRWLTPAVCLMAATLGVLVLAIDRGKMPTFTTAWIVLGACVLASYGFLDARYKLSKQSRAILVALAVLYGGLVAQIGVLVKHMR